MKYRKLGRYGLNVSEVALGGWLTHGRTMDASATREIVHKAYDLGINFFDTADVYNLGEAEKALAVAIEGIRRSNLVIATKCFFPMSDVPNDRGLSRKHIMESIDASLKRLNLDYIDLMQFHRFDSETPLDETIRAIDDAVRQGKVLYWGVSQWAAHQISDAMGICRDLRAHPPVSNQPVYNMLSRGIETSVVPACEAHGLGLVVFSPLAQGVLTGKYEPGKPAPQGSRGADEQSNQFMGDHLQDSVLRNVHALKEYVEKELGVGLAEFALAWCLRLTQVSSVIIGASRPEQIEQNIKAAGLSFSGEVWEKAEAILSRH